MAVTPGTIAIDESTQVDKLADTNQLTRNAQNVQREVVSIGSPDAATPEQIAGVNASNELKVAVASTSQVQANQGTAAAAASAWPVKSTDAGGVNQQAITAAGQAKVTGDASAPLPVTGTQADNASHATTKVPTLPARASTAAVAYTDGNDVPLQTDLNGNCRVIPALPADTTSGQQNLTTPNNAAINTNGAGTVVVQITSYTSGTANFEASVDGATWVSWTGISQTTGAPVTTAAATGVFVFPAAGLKQFRVRCSGVGGAFTCYIEASAGSAATVMVLPAQVVGNVADAASDSGNGVKQAGIAKAKFAFITAVADGQRQSFVTDLFGRQQVIAHQDDIKRLGVYYYNSGSLTVNASADTATGGRFWLINPVGSTVIVRVRQILFRASDAGTTVETTAPRINVERVTFTGTASGTTVTPALRRTADAGATGSLRTASTGMTLSAGALITSFYPPLIITAVGAAGPTEMKWAPDPDDQLDLGAGEGIVVRQPDAGTTSDTRVYNVSLIVEEF